MTHLELKKDEPALPLVCLVLCGCLGLSAWLALAGRSDMLLYGDEYLSIPNLRLGFREALGTYDERGTGVGFLLLQKLSVELLGPNPIAYRLPATLAALGALLLLYPVGRSLVGAWGALISLPLLTGASLFVHYSRFGRTYSILVLLMLVFVGCVQRWQSRQASWRTLLLMSFSAGLLPWFHLTSVASVGLVGLLGLWQLRADRIKFKKMLLALAGGVLLSCLLMLPAWEAMQAFSSGKLGAGREQAASVLDAAALMVGTRWGGALCMGLVLLALCFFPWRRPTAWGLLLCAGLTPLLAVILTRPSGAAYALARYQISALPFLMLLIGWVLVQLVSGLRRAAGGASLALGSCLAGAQLLGGPSLTDPGAFGPFAASNLSLMRLPAFDAKWKTMPAFYERLSQLDEDVRILELPEQTSRSALLYRNYQLTHQKRVSMGFMLTHKPERIPGGAHVNLRAGELESSGVDYVVYHKRIQEELSMYWVFVHSKAWNMQADPQLTPYMQAHGNFGKRFEGQRIEPGPVSKLGEPFYEDRFIQVWKVK